MGADDEKLKEFKIVLRSLLISKNQAGCTLPNLEQLYREREGRRIPLFGYVDFASLLDSLKETVQLKVYGGRMLVFPVYNDKSKHISNLIAGQNAKKPRRKTTRSRPPRNIDNGWELKKSTWTEQSTSKKCNGPSKRTTNICSNASSWQKYANSYVTTRSNQNEINSQLNSDYSIDYASSKATLKTLNDKQQQLTIVGVSEQAYNGYGKSEKLSIENEKNLTDDSSDSIGIKMDFGLLKFDEELIEFDQLRCVEFQEQFRADQSFRIFLSQTHSPYRFWFHLMEHAEHIETLMNGLEHFYYFDENEAIAKTPIPDEYLELGRLCAALYETQWHRAEIIEVFDNSVKVFYVDYGTVDEVKKENIRFLCKRFSRDPIYAHRGCLDRCKPNHGIWTLESMNAFANHVIAFSSIPIMARVTNVNEMEKTIYMDLIDTTGAVDLSISNFLIESNMAYSTKKLLYDFTKRHYNEVYPSFEKLEGGQYPQLLELKRMLDKGFDFLEYEDTIIIPEMYGYQTIE